MRKNCKRTVNAWMKGEAFGSRKESIWTDGEGIYSYATWILCGQRRGKYERGFPFNATWYGQTTRVHQNAIRAHMEDEGINLRMYDNVPKGTSYQSPEK